jgi:hypothetical protein
MSLGFIPGDAPTQRGWFSRFTRDRSIEQVRVPASEVLARYTSAYPTAASDHITAKVDANGLVSMADFDPGWWTETRQMIADIAQPALAAGAAGVVKLQLDAHEKCFTDAMVPLETAAGASFTAYKSLDVAKFQPAIAAAKKIAGFAEALGKEHNVPAEVLAGVEAAYARAEARLSAVHQQMSDAAAKVTQGFDTRSVEVMAFPMALREAIRDQLRASEGRFKWCSDKQMTQEIKAGEAIDHYLGYGELFVGKDAEDPHRTTIRSMAGLKAWCDQWIGKR